MISYSVMFFSEHIAWRTHPFFQLVNFEGVVELDVEVEIYVQG